MWNYVYSSTITLNDNTDNWYRKIRDIIDKQQSGALWMSENKVRSIFLGGGYLNFLFVYQKYEIELFI